MGLHLWDGDDSLCLLQALGAVLTALTLCQLLLPTAE